MNYIELAHKYDITNVDDAFEKLIGSDLSRSERIEVMKMLRWSYRYMRNTCIRIIKDAAYKELIPHIFDRELIPKRILAERDKYEFKRLTRFEFVDKFVERLKIYNETYGIYDEFKILATKDYPDLPFMVFGPFEAPVYKVDEKYRMRLVIKCKLNAKCRELFSRILIKYGIEAKSKTTLSIDFNPTNL